MLLLSCYLSTCLTHIIINLMGTFGTIPFPFFMELKFSDDICLTPFIKVLKYPDILLEPLSCKVLLLLSEIIGATLTPPLSEESVLILILLEVGLFYFFLNSLESRDFVCTCFNDHVSTGSPIVLRDKGFFNYLRCFSRWPINLPRIAQYCWLILVLHDVYMGNVLARQQTSYIMCDPNSTIL